MLSPLRKGIFTASEIHRLISNGSSYEPCEFSLNHTCYELTRENGYIPIIEPPKKGKKCYRHNEDYLTDGAKRYAEEKAGAYLYYDREQPTFDSFATLYGKENEYLAVEWLEKTQGLKLDLTGDEQEFFIHSSEMFGATPDGVMYDGSFINVLGIEIKCPDQHTHTANRNINTVAELKKHYPEYYWQCLAGMECVGVDLWLWCSFAPDKITENKRGHVVKIHREDVQNDIKFMLKCIQKAHKYKLQIIEEMQ